MPISLDFRNWKQCLQFHKLEFSGCTLTGAYSTICFRFMLLSITQRAAWIKLLAFIRCGKSWAGTGDCMKWPSGSFQVSPFFHSVKRSFSFLPSSLLQFPSNNSGIICVFYFALCCTVKKRKITWFEVHRGSVWHFLIWCMNAMLYHIQKTKYN